MSMDSLTVSLETAKKLKASGFPQGTVLSWMAFPITAGEGIYSHWVGEEWSVESIVATTQNFGIAAPTAEEIADQFPSIIPGPQFHGGYSLIIIAREDYWNVEYSDADEIILNGLEASDSSLVEALAAMYLNLQEAK